MKKLCYSQHSNSNADAYFCENCLHIITTTNTTHDTKVFGKVAAEYPKHNKATKFKCFYKNLSPPVMNSPSVSSTTKAEEHIACAV